jgi:hypothetical protein
VALVRARRHGRLTLFEMTKALNELIGALGMSMDTYAETLHYDPALCAANPFLKEKRHG